MYSAQFKAFMERHNIKSPGEWEKATNGNVSKSTITRGLKGEGKDVGVNTILELIAPYNETLDQFFSLGEYSEEEKEKNEIVEKIESVIDEVDNSPTIPEATANDIIETLEVAQQHIANESKHATSCPECSALSKINSYLEQNIATKNKVVNSMFKVIIIQLIIIIVLIISDTALITNLINILNP